VALNCSRSNTLKCPQQFKISNLGSITVVSAMNACSPCSTRQRDIHLLLLETMTWRGEGNWARLGQGRARRPRTVPLHHVRAALARRR
jgi:hypothetical protein